MTKNLVHQLTELGLAAPPKWLADRVEYLTLTGSVVYGASTNESDVDVYGFCTPPPAQVFPHLEGEVPGFGTQKKRFEQYQEHHLVTGQKEYDLTVYSVVKFFQLVMDGNPNMVGALFTPEDKVLFMTGVGSLVRENRQLFLSNKVYHRFRGFGFRHLSLVAGDKAREGKRADLVEKYGFDVKAAYNAVRVLLEVEQAMTEGDLTLDRNAALLQEVKSGGWTQERVVRWFTDQEEYLKRYVYPRSVLPEKPDEERLKGLLLDCLELAWDDPTYLREVRMAAGV